MSSELCKIINCLIAKNKRLCEKICSLEKKIAKLEECSTCDMTIRFENGGNGTEMATIEYTDCVGNQSFTVGPLPIGFTNISLSALEGTLVTITSAEALEPSSFNVQCGFIQGVAISF